MKLPACQLLNAYRSMWSSRSIISETNLSNEQCKSALLEAIERDLRDELTHPRVRKSLEKKFHIAIKRIMSSVLTDSEKLELISVHLEVANKSMNQGN